MAEIGNFFVLFGFAVLGYALIAKISDSVLKIIASLNR